jgi:hypothetical protein
MTSIPHHFTLPINSPPTHQPHSILSYPSKTLYFGTKFEPSSSLYTGTEGVRFYCPETRDKPATHWSFGDHFAQALGVSESYKK